MSAGKAHMWWRQRFTQPAAGIAQRIVVVSADNGTLSDPGVRLLPDTQAALDFLAARGIPLVINSGRTRAEIERLHQTLQLHTPFISEFGGALFLPHGSLPFVPCRARPAVSCDVIEFGRRYRDVVDVLRLTCRDLEVDIVGFAELSIDEAARELGVALVEAQLAKLREYSELFRLVDEKAGMRRRFVKALHRRGLRCWPASGDHLVTATADRTESLRTLRAIWKQAWGNPILIGLGECENDMVWLRHVDIAVVVQPQRAGVPARVLANLPTARGMRSGPFGWSEAIFENVGGLVSSHGENQSRKRVTDPTDAPSHARPP